MDGYNGLGCVALVVCNVLTYMEETKICWVMLVVLYPFYSPRVASILEMVKGYDA
jgi:hypothetical protein